VGVRRVPARPDRTASVASTGRPAVFAGVGSPGNWAVPPGVRPGWQWLPEHGAMPMLAAVPWWVRVWYRTPLIDRYAHEWMWWHGGWAVLVPGAAPPPDAGEAGVREPRQPRPVTGGGYAGAPGE
jgi:hypothetical protein